MYSIIILHNPTEKFPPSNLKAIEKFKNAAIANKFVPTIIPFKEITFDLINHADALFIRETTNIGGMLELVKQFENQNKPVIDTSYSILHAGSKYFGHSIAQHCEIPIVPLYTNWNEIEYPVILKLDNGCFSRDVYKIETEKELIQKLNEIKHDKIILQKYMYSPYDWRICMFDYQPLFVCRYYMAKNCWKLVDYEQPFVVGEGIGLVENVEIHETPQEVLQIANTIIQYYDEGLYGIDVKECNGNFYFMEINDNVSIDGGEEDKLIGDELYYRVIEWFYKKVKQKKI